LQDLKAVPTKASGCGKIAIGSLMICGAGKKAFALAMFWLRSFGLLRPLGNRRAKLLMKSS